MEQNGIPEWGYIFHPASSSLVSAFSQLDVNICAKPTELHYDPERLAVPVISQNGALQQVTISHPWHGRQRLPLSFGRIVLRDRKGKIVEAFTAGGELTITVSGGCTCCHICSPVPLYRLANEKRNSPESAAASVVDKIEALVAVRRAKWGGNELEFQQRLTSIGPANLYAAGLQSMQAALDRTPSNLRGARYYEMARGVNRAILSAQESGEWPAQSYLLEELV